MRERELAKERKRLEQEQLRLQEMALAGCRMENGGESWDEEREEGEAEEG